jgi:hypothetical protein
MKRILIILFVAASSIHLRAEENTVSIEAARGLGQVVVDNDEDSFKELLKIPRVDYPKDFPIYGTPFELVELHIATITAPTSTWKELPKVADVDKAWIHAKSGDEIYDITNWFLTAKQQTVRRGNVKRWIYYNKTTGYIIAKADFFLKSTIQTFAWHSMMLNGVSPRLQMIYMEVSDKVELNFEAIRKSLHDVLFRNTMSLKSQRPHMNGGEQTQGVSLSGYSVDIADPFHEYDRRMYRFNLNVNVGETVVYKNVMDLVPSHWVIHECGISEKGKRKVLALKVDHVSHLGESISFPGDESAASDNAIKADDGLPDDPFAETSYKFYKVPVDMFQTLGPHRETADDGDPFAEEKEEELKPNMKNVSSLFQLQGFENTEVYYFHYESLILVKCSMGEHRNFKGFLDHLELRRWFPSLESRLLLYEIDFLKDYETRLWKIEDVLSGNPVKLGSMGSMLVSGEDATMKSGNDACVLTLNYIETAEPLDRRPEDRILHWDLYLPLMNITHKDQTRVDLGQTKVICLGKHPTNGKLIMMVANVGF